MALNWADNTESDLDHTHVHAVAAEQLQGQRGRHVEEARAEVRVLSQAIDVRPDAAEYATQRLLGYGSTIDSEPLAPALQVG